VVWVPKAPVTPHRFLQLIADGHRWRLMAELASSDLRVSELTRRVGEPQNLVSYHLRELREARLVSSRRSSFDGRDAYYRLDLTRCGELLSQTAASLHPGLLLHPSLPAHPAASTRPTRVLFLCTGNSARSQIAEALLTHRSGGAVEARSAGSHPKALHPNAVRVMARRGIDIAGHPTKHLRRFARTHFDHVITLCDKVREVCPKFPGHPLTAHWSIADPATEGLTDDETLPAFEGVACELDDRIGHLIARLSTKGGHAHAG
jgi:protein-tyrosine-phosphatase/DNA-binding transcriptional ArsR family regulator